MTGFWDDADIISTYTRAQAIEDGALLDVSALAREAGFRLPLAITAGVHALLSDIPQDSGEDYTGRLWDVLWMASLAAKRNGSKDAISFDVIIHTTDRPRGEEVRALWMKIGPGDTDDPVLTIMLSGED